MHLSQAATQSTSMSKTYAMTGWRVGYAAALAVLAAPVPPR